MSRLIITPLAARDIEAVTDYIAERSPGGARKLADRIKNVCDLLRNCPKLGPARPDLGKGLRMFVIENYLVMYRDIGDGAEIVRFIDGRRNLDEIF